MKRSLLIFAILILFGSSSFAGDFAIEVYQAKSKAVVLIVAKTEGRSPMVGAGSVISDSGIIVTNAHVVIDKSISRPFSDIKVYFKPDKVTGSQRKDLVNAYKTSVKAFDIDLDIAIIKIEDLPPDTGVIKFAKPEEVRIGGEIFNQKGIEGKDVYQTDTSLNRGNSGGPLLDRRGYMVGINTNIARLGAGNLPITGVNFALKSVVVKNWLGEQGVMIAYGTKPLYKETEVVEAKREDVKPEDNILTPKRPYKIDDLFKEAERELEGLMDEMRGKIKR